MRTSTRTSTSRQQRAGTAGNSAGNAGASEGDASSEGAGNSAGSTDVDAAGDAGTEGTSRLVNGQGANTVDVDPAQLAADAERAVAASLAQDAAAAPDPAPGGQGDAAAPVVDSWRPLIEGLTPTVRMTVFVQWQIPANLEGEFINSLTMTLDALLPGGMSGKYAGIARLLVCCAGITFINYSANGGSLPPLGPKKRDEKPATDAGTAAASS